MNNSTCDIHKSIKKCCPPSRFVRAVHVKFSGVTGGDHIWLRIAELTAPFIKRYYSWNECLQQFLPSLKERNVKKTNKKKKSMLRAGLFGQKTCGPSERCPSVQRADWKMQNAVSRLSLHIYSATQIFRSSGVPDCTSSSLMFPPVSLKGLSIK